MHILTHCCIDTSANICFESPDIASEALNSLSLASRPELAGIHGLQLRAAKPLSSNPSPMLQVRIAVATDRKKPRAREASRFYMMHPELDPREKRRSSNRRHRPERNSSRRRRSNGGNESDSFMRDRTPRRFPSHSRRNSSNSSYSSDPQSSKRGQRRRRNRDRSASPNRAPRNNRFRNRTPPPKYSRRDPYPFNRANTGKELFPTSTAKVVNSGKELLPNKTVAANLKKELFPTLKAGPGIPSHRRTNSIDATSQAADLFASRMTVPFVDGAADGFPLHSDSVQRPASFSIRGTATTQNDGGTGLSIKGVAATQNDGGGTGFSIKGSAGDGQTVKELFPTKLGNRGKELFAGRGARNKADMFYWAWWANNDWEGVGFLNSKVVAGSPLGRSTCEARDISLCLALKRVWAMLSPLSFSLAMSWIEDRRALIPLVLFLALALYLSATSSHQARLEADDGAAVGKIGR